MDRLNLIDPLPMLGRRVEAPKPLSLEKMHQAIRISERIRFEEEEHDAHITEADCRQVAEVWPQIVWDFGSVFVTAEEQEALREAMSALCADDDGWIEWKGGRPATQLMGLKADVRFSTGDTVHDVTVSPCAPAWTATDGQRVVAYRVIAEADCVGSICF